MKRLSLFVCILLLAMTAFCSAAKKVIAVMPFVDESGCKEHRVSEIMTDYLVDALNQSGRAVTVERGPLASAIREFSFNNTVNLLKPMAMHDAAVQVGRMTGANYSLVGTITVANVTPPPRSCYFPSSLQTFNAYGNLQTFNAYIKTDIKMFNNATGECVKGTTVLGFGIGRSAKIALYNACKKAVEDLLGPGNTPVVPAVITKAENNMVHIDMGAEQGIKKGDMFEIVKEGKPIQKPDGTMIMKYIPLGKAKVIMVNADHAVCKVIKHEGDLSITNGAIVRRIKK